MSLDKFKKLSDDEHKAVLEHPDGHQITVAKKALSKDFLTQLDGLPLHMNQGGSVTAPPIPSNDDLAFAMRTLGLDSATAGQRFASEQASMPKTVEEMQAMERSPASLPVPDPSRIVSDPPMVPGAPQAPQAPQVAPGQQASGLSNVNLGQQSPQGQSKLLPQSGVTQSGLNGYKSGLNQEAQGMAQQGHEQAKAAEQSAKDLQDLQENFQISLADHTAEYEALKADYIAEHIKPNHYVESMDATQRVGTAIGLILGGFGSALAGQENAAMSFLNKQIDRDIKAQEAELGKKHNLLSANLQRFGNLRDATQMTQAMMMGIMSAKFKQAESKAMDPIAKGRAKQAGAEWDMKAAPLLQELSTRQALLQGQDLSKIDPAVALPAFFPKDERDHAFKDLSGYKEVQEFGNHVLDTFDKVAEINTLGNRTLNPIQTHEKMKILEPVVAEISKKLSGSYSEADAAAWKSAFKTVMQDDKTVAASRKNLEKIFEARMEPHALRFKSKGQPLPGLKKKGNYINKG